MIENSAKSSRYRILVVDDEPDIISTFATLLEMHGYDSLAANNGKEALQLVLQEQPDLIISDCMMPVMDGIELTRQLKQHVTTQQIPVILMSGAPHMHRLSDAGHATFLHKPVKLSELLSTIEVVLAAGEQ